METNDVKTLQSIPGEESLVPIILIHVFKTGGMTLARRLASAFLPKEAWFFQKSLSFPDDVQLFEELKNSKKFIESHFNGELLQNSAGLDMLSTVREPISQIISAYRHIRRVPQFSLCRPARIMPPEAFFDSFADFFKDYQTRNILEAFYPMWKEEIQKGYYHAWYDRLYTAIDKLRWLVPTEAIDEFIPLWSLETKRQVPNCDVDLNVAPEDGCEVGTLRRLLHARPDLYALDSLLWQIAQERFALYRAKVHEIFVPWSWPDNSRRAYAQGETGIWLTENWYDPTITRENIAWGAGPAGRSVVRFKRKHGQCTLSFDVSAAHGLMPKKINVFAKNSFAELPLLRSASSPGAITYRIALDGLELEGQLLVIVPIVMAPIMIDGTDTSTLRMSFLASNWSLSEDKIEVSAEAKKSALSLPMKSFFYHTVFEQSANPLLQEDGSLRYVRQEPFTTQEPALFFGPYIPLNAGRYQLILTGHAIGSVHISFVYGSGVKTIKTCIVSELEKPIEFELVEPAMDFEIVTRAELGLEVLEIKHIEIIPI